MTIPAIAPPDRPAAAGSGVASGFSSEGDGEGLGGDEEVACAVGEEGEDCDGDGDAVGFNAPTDGTGVTEVLGLGNGLGTGILDRWACRPSSGKDSEFRTVSELQTMAIRNMAMRFCKAIIMVAGPAVETSPPLRMCFGTNRERLQRRD